MPKSQYVDPNRAFDSGFIRFHDIPVCQYNLTIEDEKRIYSKQDLINIYRDMAIIREFETMLNEIKTKSVYNGVEYNNPGPAHLSLGQEASAVGQAYCLDNNDFTFGSHRSHGEIIAKGLSSIKKLDNTELYDIMKTFLDGSILSVVEGKEEVKGDVKDLAIDFLLYGALAEIFARRTGFNRGLGGSMHAFFIPFGIFPNNAIVGGSAAIALGAALYKRSNHKKGIVIANSGDGALGRGPVLEALNMSSMDQIKQLWGEGGGMPILFNVFNNFYGMGGQTKGETMAWGQAARVGAGVNPDQMHAESVNGYDPLAVIDATTRQKDLLLRGEGPAMLEVITYRTTGHSPSDSSTYRTQEEMEFQDEFDTPIDVPAKERFHKYRALESMKSGVWNPTENLPKEYGSIFSFDNIKNTYKQAVKSAIEDGMKLSGHYVKVSLMNFNFDDVIKYRVKEIPCVLSTLLDHERKLCVMNYKFTPYYEQEDHIIQNLNKKVIECQCGFRRYLIKPIFSADNYGSDKVKFQKYLQKDKFFICTAYAQLTYANNPVLFFTR